MNLTNALTVAKHIAEATALLKEANDAAERERARRADDAWCPCCKRRGYVNLCPMCERG